MSSMNPLAYLCRFSLCLAIALGFLQVAGFAATKSKAAANNQKSVLWQQKTDGEIQSIGRRFATPEKYLVYGLNRNNLNGILDQAPLEFSAEAARRIKPVILEIPAPDGNITRFRIEDSPLLSPEVAAQFPGWKTFQGYGIDDSTATARFDVTPSGFHAYILSSRGTFIIDPYQENDRGNYITYFKADLNRTNSFHCALDEEISQNAVSENPDASFSIGAQIRTYRLAVAATGEYTNFFRQPGDTDAQAQTRALNAIVITVNRINGIYRKDLALNFTLVSGVNIVYPNPAADPYANTSSDLNSNQTTIDTVIGSANYDMGHLVGTGGGGVAQLGVPCRAGSKAKGLTGSPAPVGDPFDIDYVAHEMGHQVGANHTFNATTGSCGGGNRVSVAAYEPGSAATIMGYAGICGAANLQRNSIDNFHIVSQTEAIAYTVSGLGASCGTVSGTNAVPTITPLTNYSIPFNTPFTLAAAAADTDGDALNYSWEQYDSGAASDYPGTPDDDDTNLTVRPLFRTYTPTANAARTFPSLPYILNNANEPPVNFTGTAPTGIVCTFGTCVTGEDLPSIARTMNFRVAVRDGKGGVADAGMTVASVNTTTPFKVTTGNTATTLVGGAARTITWDVSNTNAAPINTANVKISLSADGGQTFPTVLAASTANDGSESLIIPNTPNTQTRIKIEAIGNIYFDINDANLTIGTVGGPAEVAAGAVAVISESCGIANGMPDPGETLTVSLPLSNSGGTNTANLTATLQATGGVVSAVSQTYGVVAAGGTAVTRNFTFTVSPTLTCGSPVVLTFVITDGAATFPNVTRTYSTGVNVVTFSQNFDGVTVPALPAGWTSVQTSGTGINWITTTTTPSSPPNAAFANEPETTNAAALISPAVAISSTGAQITFKNRFNLEDTWDGTVLEYSTDGGTTWTDVITGGGSFASGGYNTSIQSNAVSPIAGRAAWSGNSNGYIDTVVNLPASLNGQNVRFRWLSASDSSEIATGTPGSWVDEVQILGGRVCQSCTTGSCQLQRRSDFNGDGITDYAVFRPSSGVWYVQPNGAGSPFGAAFGQAGDQLQPADYDGDGKTDLGVFRAGIWYWIRSSDNTVRSATWGAASDVPAAGDYLGTAQAEVAVYRPGTGIWYVLNTADNSMVAVRWGGAASDVPALGDFDGDCRLDFAVRRTTNENGAGGTRFYILQSAGNVAASIQWGRDDMAMAIADYDGDGKSDVGVADGRGGLLYWYVYKLGGAGAVLLNGTQFGQAGDVVTVGNYDADGRADLSIWRPSSGTFAARSTVSGTEMHRMFGAAGDLPTARAGQYPLP